MNCPKCPHAELIEEQAGEVTIDRCPSCHGLWLDEKYFNGTLKAEYNLTRTVAVRASYTFEKLKSTSVGSDYTANVFLLGLRFQR